MADEQCLGPDGRKWRAWLFWFRLWLPVDTRERERRLAIFASNYGRSQGWRVFKDGVAVADLSAPSFEDDFWESYAVNAIPGGHVTQDELMDDRYWDDVSRFSYRSKATGDWARAAFSAADPVQNGRLHMRCLSLMVAPPTPWEHILLYARKRSTREHDSAMGN